MRLYDKRDEFDFPIVNFPYLNSNIPESSAYAVLVSQLIPFARLFSKHEDILRGSILVAKLLKQGYSSQKLHCSRDILHGNFRLLLRNYMVAIHTYVSHMLKGLFTNCDTWLVSLFWKIVTGATCGAQHWKSDIQQLWFENPLSHDDKRGLQVNERTISNSIAHGYFVLHRGLFLIDPANRPRCGKRHMTVLLNAYRLVTLDH